MYDRLPHGPSGMEREEVARNQRTRLYGGMIESVSQRGYHATTVAHVIALAGVSRRAFYELFANKEECFLATYDIIVARARKRVFDAWTEERGWANRLHAGCKALLDDVAAQPKGPRLVLVDSLGVGPAARGRMQLAGLAFERLVAGALQAAPDGVGFSRPDRPRDRRRRPPRRVHADARAPRARAGGADRRSARLDRVLSDSRGGAAGGAGEVRAPIVSRRGRRRSWRVTTGARAC